MLSAGGPQFERDKHFKSASIAVARGGLSFERNSEKQVYEGELVRLRRENESFRDQLQRTLVELKAYQLKFPTVHVTPDPTESENLPPWITSPEATSPLLKAYDDRIKELEDIVEQQTTQLEVFQEKFDKVVGENDTLRNMNLEQLKRSGGAGRGSGGTDLHPMSVMNEELINEMNERIEILMAENALMVEQKSALATELDTIQDELTTRTELFKDLSTKSQTLGNELVEARSRMGKSEQNLEDASAQIVALTEMVGKLETERDDFTRKSENLERETTTADANLSEMRKKMKALTAKAEEEAVICVRRVKDAEDRVRELQGTLMQKTQELDLAQENLRKLRREYQSTRQDAEGMLQVMGGLERQLSEYSSREAEVDRVVREAKEKVESALSEREQALASEEQARSEIERLLAERKSLALAKQRDINDALELCRKRMQEQVKSAEEDTANLAHQIVTIKLESEKASKECRSAKEALEKFKRVQIEERKQTSASVRSMGDKLSTLSSSKEDEAGKRKTVQELNKDLRGLVDQMRVQLESQRSQYEQRIESLEAELANSRLAFRECKRDIEENERIIVRKQKDYDDLKNESNASLAAAEQRRVGENSAFRRRAVEAENIHRELTLAIANEERRVQTVIEELTKKYTATINILEASRSEEHSNFERQMIKTKDVESLLKETNEEKAILFALIERSKGAVETLQEELSGTREVVDDLTKDLLHSHEVRDSLTRASEEEDSSK
jgi:chromosome segregation ATPase